MRNDFVRHYILWGSNAIGILWGSATIKATLPQLRPLLRQSRSNRKIGDYITFKTSPPLVNYEEDPTKCAPELKKNKKT